MTPNHIEAESATNSRISTHEDARRASSELRKRIGVDSVLITRGEHGMWLDHAGTDGYLPASAREVGAVYLDTIDRLSEKIAGLEGELRRQVAAGDVTARLMTMPGVGPITAAAIEAFAPPMGEFRRGRDFAAWLGLVPRQHSSGGKESLGKTSKMGQRDIRRLLIVGAMAQVRWAARNGAPQGSWLARMLGKKPRLVVAIALANRMARCAWAMLTKNEDYREPVAAVA